jgi:hypothetical protein
VPDKELTAAERRVLRAAGIKGTPKKVPKQFKGTRTGTIIGKAMKAKSADAKAIEERQKAEKAGGVRRGPR